MRSRSRRFQLLMVMLAGLALLSWGGARAAAAETLDFSAFLSSECALSSAVDDGDLSFLDDQAAAAPAEPAAPGKACKTNKDCVAKTEWCSKKEGDCKGEGNCMKRPLCTTGPVTQVCGCNHRNYSNECMAHAAGVNVDHAGKCKKKGKY